MTRLRFTIFSILADAALVNAAVIAAFFVRFFGQVPSYNFRAYLALAPLLTVGYLIAGWLYGLYEPEQLDSPWSVTSHVLQAVTLGTFLLVALAFLGGAGTTAFSRWTIPLTGLFALILLIGWRLLFLRFATIQWPEQRTIIVGLSETAADLARSLCERTKWGWDFLGFVMLGSERVHTSETIPASAPAPDVRSTYAGFPVLGTDTDLPALIERHDINRVLVAEPIHLREFVESLVLDDFPRLSVDVVPELYETFIGHTDTIVGDIPLMRIVSGFTPRYQRIVKRSIDVGGAVVVLLVTSPLTVMVALASLVSQGRPLLYKQARVGRDLKEFQVYKFRTMVRDAEGATGPILAASNDPRVTPVGRFLRKFRIDELPQLLNILR
ncbi:MAG: sugar transferase, partial [Actinomycetes bacterium]|nr:sugar transferase [Actinomycetes bacterium]